MLMSGESYLPEIFRFCKSLIEGMTKTKRMTRNQNHDDNASSKKKVNNGDVGPWSDLNDHPLYLVVMKLGVVDYLSFGGVCKSWRTLAVSNRKAFMASKPSMKMCISWHGCKKICHLEDFEGRKFKTILPRFDGGVYVGLTCGYLIFYPVSSGLNFNNLLCDPLYQLRLNSEPKLTLLETKNSFTPSQFLRLGDNILCDGLGSTKRGYYLYDGSLSGQKIVTDFGEMRWVSREKKIGEYASFLSDINYGVVVTRLWTKKRGQGLLQGHNMGDMLMLKLVEVEKPNSFKVSMWYFPHECLNVDLVNE
uniref:F-box domain-containing protein n=1 Tax=Lactuca sativa TaxID=4236 RepID=A0A9R1UX68_LACSA|nr:hypothetical protein LSAT_V11C700345190 [Lactuca sativa]